ncbi:hypothetical protein [Acinetobacter sp. BSP-28]|uniref:hypothetical protein n=1 Tax=Acinetobacter sp. BSP-28 TaxID=3344661 RepID=UPI0037702271
MEIQDLPPPFFKKYNKVDLKKWLGEISFPLYAIHYPILLITPHFMKGGITGEILIIFCLALSYYAAKFIDYPLRKKLQKINFTKV